LDLSKLTDLGYGDVGLRSHTVDHNSIKLERAKFPLMPGPKAPDNSDRTTLCNILEDGLVVSAGSIRTSTPHERWLLIFQTSNCCYRLRFERLHMSSIPLVGTCRNLDRRSHFGYTVR
jgi:hypothetical protein